MNIKMNQLTGLPFGLRQRGDTEADVAAKRLAHCRNVADALSVYSGDDVFVSTRGWGMLHDTQQVCRLVALPQGEDRLRVSAHLVKQWRTWRNDSFAVIRHDDGQALAVSIVEFVGLGKPELVEG